MTCLLLDHLDRVRDRRRGIQTLLREIDVALGARKGILLQTLANALETQIIVNEQIYFPRAAARAA